MSAIERIEIFDFQSHHRTVLEPAPAGQLTVIVGPSDSGKTSIIRSLRWNCYNVPQGTDFINVKATTAKVAVSFANGRTIIRERHRKNYNRYQVLDGEKPEMYEGFGATVPAEVQEITGVRPVTIGDMELNLNLTEQLDGPFLGKSVSAGARAKVLGKLAGTEEVDYAAKQLNTDLYRRRQDEKNLVTEIARLQEDLKKYDYLQALGETINQVAGVLAGVKEAQEKKVWLEKLRADLQAINQQVQACNRQIDSLTMFIIAAGPLAGGTEASVTRHAQLVSGSRKLAEIKAGITAAQSVLDITAGVTEAGRIAGATGVNAGALARLKKLQTDIITINTGIRAAVAIISRTENIAEACQLAVVAGAKSEKFARLRTLKGTLDSVKKGIRRCDEQISNLVPVAEAEPIAVSAAACLNKLSHLRPLAASLRNIDSGIGGCAEQISRLALLTDADDAMIKTKDNYHRLYYLEIKRGQLAAWQRDVAELTVTVENRTTMVRTLQEEYQNLLTAAGVCPTCGAGITQFKLKEVI